jgi:hypothetical protein
MSAASNPTFDHGSAVRTPAPHDRRNWAKLWLWLGDDGAAGDEPGAVEVRTPEGWVIARPGDWIILTFSGSFHVAAAL